MSHSRSISLKSLSYKQCVSFYEYDWRIRALVALHSSMPVDTLYSRGFRSRFKDLIVSAMSTILADGMSTDVYRKIYELERLSKVGSSDWLKFPFDFI